MIGFKDDSDSQQIWVQMKIKSMYKSKNLEFNGGFIKKRERARNKSVKAVKKNSKEFINFTLKKLSTRF